MKYHHSLAATVFFGALGYLAQAQDIEPAAREASARPTETPQNDTVRFILMSDGRILVGEASEDKEGGYAIRQKLGTIRVSHDDVEGMFPSLRAIYEHKREHLPPRDIQERMRLYRWCMSYQLLDQAREQLQAVLALSPDHEEAKSNLGLLEIRIARMNTRVDDQLVRTSATKVSSEAPREMDPAFLNRALREMASRNSPIIFDLPEAQAVKRGQEFNQHIHPLLQMYCAGCHNERTPNGFPLVSATGRASRDPSLLRANLDTTLKLVDQANLMQSPLLVNSLLPHKPNNRPIFPGPNHPAYRIFANWVSQLQPKAGSNVRADRFDAREPYANAPQEVTQTSFGQPMSFPERSVSSGFAVEGRLRPEADDQPNLPIEANPDAMNAKSPRGQLPGQGFEAAEPAMPGRILPGTYNGAAPEPPKGTKYPLPLPAGASPEDLLKALQAEESARDAKDAAAAEKPAKPAAPVEEDAPPPKPARDAGPVDKSKKPVKIDQNLLDRIILQRRSGG